MKKQKESVPENAALEPENIKNIKKSLRSRKIDLNKRMIYLAALLFCIVLAILFVRQTRHDDDRTVGTENPVSSFLPREDITGKQPVVMGTGNYTAGKDIEPGRYMVTTQGGYGSFVVYELDSKLTEVSEVLGYFADPAYVPSIALTLVENQEIEIKGAKLGQVTFTPLATEFLTELTTGIWVAGLDIEPGTYTISSKDGRNGSVSIFNGDLPYAKVLLGKGGAKYKESEIITLESNQTIRVASIPTVVFNRSEIS